MLLPFVACGEKETDTNVEEPKGATLELTSAEVVEFDAEGGEGAITFEYDGNNLNTNGPSEPTTGRVLTIECDADWISVAQEVDVLASAINFEVAANDTEEAREAVIKASIKDLSIEVLVKQAAAANGGNNDEPKDEFVEGWAINGTMNDWAKKDATPMNEEGDFFVVKGFELTAEDNFNFILNGNEKSIGGNGRTSEPNFVYEAMSWGSNISVAEAGVYDIYLSTDLKYYYIMTDGQNPADAKEPLKPGDKRWSLFGSFEGNNREEDIILTADGKYLSVRGVKFVDDMTFVIRCNGGEAGVLGVASNETYAVENAINLVEKSESTYEIKAAVEAGVKYDIYFIYAEEASQLWVMPEGRYPVIWDRVEGAYMPSYNNFILYLITSDVVLSLDFKAGNESVVNYVIPEGTYYLGDTEGNGWCFDMDYCLAKVRGREIPLFDGYMTVEHKDGKYDIFVDMRTATLDVLKMHYVGEIGYDPFFTNMGGHELNNPEK